MYSQVSQHKQPGGTDAVALCFAGLFALPSMRSVMPGDPPFGETLNINDFAILLI